MSLIFSRSCQYAIQAVIYLSAEREGTAVHVREISDALSIPHHFLGKTLQILVREGIAQSTKGANGGFRLGRPSSEIRLVDIVHAVDGPSTMDQCILGFPECREDKPCALHDEWNASREIIVRMLTDTTVDTLTKRLAPKLIPTPKKLTTPYRETAST